LDRESCDNGDQIVLKAICVGTPDGDLRRLSQLVWMLINLQL
jgi:hypothetical protein